MERSVHILGSRVHLGTVLQEKHYDIDVAETRADVQWSLLFASTCIHLSAVSQQDADNIGLKRRLSKFSSSVTSYSFKTHLISTRCQVQRSLSTNSWYIWAGIVLQKINDNIHTSHE